MPLDFLVVQAFDAYELERLQVARALASDMVLVNLFREPVGAPMPPDAVNALTAACSRRAGLARVVTPHQLRHAFGSNLADAGGGLDEIQELLGHASLSSTQIYMDPDPGRLRAAAEVLLLKLESKVAAHTGCGLIGGAVRIWDPDTGRHIGPALTGHINKVTAITAIPRPDGHTRILARGRNGTVLVYAGLSPIL